MDPVLCPITSAGIHVHWHPNSASTCHTLSYPSKDARRFPLLQLLRWQCMLQDLLQSQYRFHKPLTSCSPTKRNLGRSGQASEPARQWAPLIPIQRAPNPSWQCNTGVNGFLNFFYLFIFYNEVRFVFCLSAKYLINTENYVSQNYLLFAHTYFLPSLHLRPSSTETKRRSL